MATTAAVLTLENEVRAVAAGRRDARIGTGVADSTGDELRATCERHERAPHQQSDGDDASRKQKGSDGAEAATGKGHVSVNERIETTAAGTHAETRERAQAEARDRVGAVGSCSSKAAEE
jgi:hypothetical protein